MGGADVRTLRLIRERWENIMGYSSDIPLGTIEEELDQLEAAVKLYYTNGLKWFNEEPEEEIYEESYGPFGCVIPEKSPPKTVRVKREFIFKRPKID